MTQWWWCDLCGGREQTTDRVPFLPHQCRNGIVIALRRIAARDYHGLRQRWMAAQEAQDQARWDAALAALPRRTEEQ